MARVVLAARSGSTAVCERLAHLPLQAASFHHHAAERDAWCTRQHHGAYLKEHRERGTGRAQMELQTQQSFRLESGQASPLSIIAPFCAVQAHGDGRRR